MRRLMWFSIGFAGACAAAVYILNGAVPVWLCVAFFALCACSLLVRNLPWGRVLAVVLAGCTVGFLWNMGYDALFLRAARAYDGQTMNVIVRATDFSYENDYGIVVDGKVELDSKEYRVRAYVNEKIQLTPGSTVTGAFRLRYTASGGQEDPTYHRGEGTFLLAYPRGDMQMDLAREQEWQYLPSYLRQGVLDTIRAAFPEDAAAFACALLLGDSSGFDYETDTAFKLSGIRHVIAVSGLHVSILFSLIYLLTGKRRFLSAIVGIPLLLLFAAMAGFTPSIVRACLMQLLMLISVMALKEYDPPTALAFAVLTMLAINPQTVTSAGFQLSVCSVASIFLFFDRIQNWILGRLRGPVGRWRRLVNGIVASVGISLSVMVLTVPLSAAYFGTVSLVGPLTNLLTLWVISFIFCGIIAVCILFLIYAPLGHAVAWCVAWPIRYVLQMAKWLGGLPVAAVYTESVYITAWLVLCYILLVIFLRSPGKQPVVFVCCVCLGLCAALLASWLEPVSSQWRMTVLDVGQGQCVILQSGRRTYIVDCGGSNDEDTADLAAATLLSQGITHVDGMILTHYDKDHVGGAAYLMSRVAADTLYLPGVEDVDGIAPELEQMDSVKVTEDLLLQWDGGQITIFASREAKTDNETSLCVLFQGEKCDILITGDRNAQGELELLRYADLPDLEILVAGHHGSANSTSELLLHATRPDTVVISVEEDNQYGHPSQTLLDRLTYYGCAVRRTDEEGTITLWG